jgi:peptidyl-tRNA hydrolase
VTLTHYVIVRRDLTVGQVCAQIVHAAGASVGLLYASSSVLERQAGNGLEVGGSIPSSRATSTGAVLTGGASLAGEIPASRANPYLPDDTIAVVLSVRDESRLHVAARRLDREGIPYVLIREADMGDAATAIGVMPLPRERVGRAVKDCVIYPLEEPEDSTTWESY